MLVHGRVGGCRGRGMGVPWKSFSQAFSSPTPLPAAQDVIHPRSRISGHNGRI